MNHKRDKFREATYIGLNSERPLSNPSDQKGKIPKDEKRKIVLEKGEGQTIS